MGYESVETTNHSKPNETFRIKPTRMIESLMDANVQNTVTPNHFCRADMDLFQIKSQFNIVSTLKEST